MGKWLSKFSDNTLENRTDKADILPSGPSVSEMSVPLSSILPNMSGPSPENSPPASALLTAPDRYCPRCGGGYWVRPTAKAPYQCGRCIPCRTRVETILLSGGTAPAKTAGKIEKESSPPIIEPSMKPDGSPLSPIYWQTGDGRILGPATPEFLAKADDQFWIVTTFEGHIRWINADRLRSKNAFVNQRAVHEVELI